MNMLYQDQAFSNWANGYSSTDIAAPNPADGCLTVVQGTNGAGNTVGKPAWFLYRFGVIFAANPFAHQLVPDLPVARGREATLARQLAAELQ
jgi:hypothetical protein